MDKSSDNSEIKVSDFGDLKIKMESKVGGSGISVTSFNKGSGVSHALVIMNTSSWYLQENS